MPDKVSRRGALLGFVATGAVGLMACGPAVADPLAVGLFTALGGVTIPEGVDLIRTSGHGVVGRGAARYRRVSSGPETLWRGRSANGGWFEIAEDVIDAAMVGAVGGRAPEDAALQAMLDAHVVTGSAAAQLTAGKTFTLEVGLVAKGPITLRGDRATLRSPRDIILLTASHSGVRVDGVNFVGPGRDFHTGSVGFLAQGATNAPGVAPTFLRDIKITRCRFTNLRYGGVWLKYVNGGEVAAAQVRDCGYFGVETIGCKNVVVLAPDVDGLCGDNNTFNAYGVSFACNETSKDFIRHPSSENCWVRGGVFRNVVWHAMDTHGGVGCGFEDAEVFDCRRAAIITSRNGRGPIRCVTRRVRASNGFPVGATHPDGSEKRAEAFWIFGDADTNDTTRAIQCVIEDSQAKGHGSRKTFYGSISMGNAKGCRIERVTVEDSLYSGITLYGGCRDFVIRDATIIDVHSAGVAAGGTDVPRYVDVAASGAEVVTGTLDGLTLVRRNPGRDRFVGVAGVFVRDSSGVRINSVRSRIDAGVATPVDIRPAPSSVAGDLQRLRRR